MFRIFVRRFIVLRILHHSADFSGILEKHPFMSATRVCPLSSDNALVAFLIDAAEFPGPPCLLQPVPRRPESARLCHRALTAFEMIHRPLRPEYAGLRALPSCVSYPPFLHGAGPFPIRRPLKVAVFFDALHRLGVAPGKPCACVRPA